MRTALFSLHTALGAKFVDFAGHDLPVCYPLGIVREHLHTRSQAGLFDIGHMGQIVVSGSSAAAQLTRLMPSDLTRLAVGRLQYTVLTNSEGGVIDDIIVANTGPNFLLIVNAVNKHQVYAHLQQSCSRSCRINFKTRQALLALQGPRASAVLESIWPEAGELSFMQGRAIERDGVNYWLSRCGYTGEDGFEIALSDAAAPALASTLLQFDAVEPIGLGARDTLRLEAGLCLYGHELNAHITPVEAGLSWLLRPEHNDFPGAKAMLNRPTTKRRVGLLVDGKLPVRQSAVLTDSAGEPVGSVTSGSYAPTLGRPVAMAYVEHDFANEGTRLWAQVRGRSVTLTVTRLPFIAPRYHRSGKH